MKTSSFVFSCIILLTALWLSGCEEEREEVLVTGNTPPADTATSRFTVETYVNKVYITTMGRKPVAAEFDQTVSSFMQEGFTFENRESFLDTLLRSSEHRAILYDRMLVDLLNNVDSLEIQNEIDAFNVAITDPQFEELWPQLEREIAKMETLKASELQFINGQLTVTETHKIMVNNRIYDDINMGSLNYVLSVFEYFLQRNPTEAEEEAAVRMVDGFPDTLFLQEGRSKTEFIDIFFSTNDYRAGLVGRLYSDYLFRTPTQNELDAGLERLGSANDYIALEISILASEDFIE